MDKPKIENCYIVNEQFNLETHEEILLKLERKWFKTFSTKKEIEILKKYIELKKKLIKDLKSFLD